MVSLEWALKSLSGCSAGLRSRGRLFQSSGPRVQKSASLFVWVTGTKKDLGYISTADQHQCQRLIQEKICRQEKSLKLEVTAVMWILFSAPVTDNTAGHEPDSKTIILRLLCSKLVLVLTHLDETIRTKPYSEQITQSRQPNVCVADQRRQKHYAEVNAALNSSTSVNPGLRYLTGFPKLDGDKSQR